jgi:glyoxylase-like metal-dependent hydrolase (beta-lactamase superfamily II)
MHVRRGGSFGACRAALVIGALGLAGTVAFGQGPDLAGVAIQVLPVQGNVYMLVGAGGNITVQAGSDGVVLVDTQYAGLSERIVAAVRTISDQPIKYIINTHVHGDHTGGNVNLAGAGRGIAPSAPGQGAVGTAATIIAHENVLTRMTNAQPPVPTEAWPNTTYFSGTKELYMNGEAIQIMYQPNAHTDGDSIVYFRGSDVVSSGDVFVTTTYPFIDRARGGTLQGIIDAANNILDITIPKHEQEGGTYVIPGHGRLCDEHDVLEYRDMLTIIRDRIRDMAARGLTLDQVKAARPTLDYDPRWGADSGFWTTDMFVEAVHQELSVRK